MSADGDRSTAARGRHRPPPRRRRRRGHHGGAWKIAFADLMTAMMAFFLVMWLFNAPDKEKIQKIATYFNPIKLNAKKPTSKGIQETRTFRSRPRAKRPKTPKAAAIARVTRARGATSAPEKGRRRRRCRGPRRPCRGRAVQRSLTVFLPVLRSRRAWASSRAAAAKTMGYAWRRHVHQSVRALLAEGNQSRRNPRHYWTRRNCRQKSRRCRSLGPGCRFAARRAEDGACADISSGVRISCSACSIRHADAGGSPKSRLGVRGHVRPSRRCSGQSAAA